MASSYATSPPACAPASLESSAAACLLPADAALSAVLLVAVSTAAPAAADQPYPQPPSIVAAAFPEPRTGASAALVAAASCPLPPDALGSPAAATAPVAAVLALLAARWRLCRGGPSFRLVSLLLLPLLHYLPPVLLL